MEQYRAELCGHVIEKGKYAGSECAMAKDHATPRHKPAEVLEREAELKRQRREDPAGDGMTNRQKWYEGEKPRRAARQAERRKDPENVVRHKDGTTENFDQAYRRIRNEATNKGRKKDDGKG